MFSMFLNKTTKHSKSLIVFAMFRGNIVCFVQEHIDKKYCPKLLILNRYGVECF